VADIFLERFRALFHKKSVTPKRVLGLSDGTLRKIGISWAKMNYLKDLAHKLFSLGREDLFSCGDLGLQKAIEEIYNIKNLTRSKAEELSIKWSPYRTYASLVIWRSREGA
jgi:DNA-3-methyladenine glycosylase II